MTWVFKVRHGAWGEGRRRRPKAANVQTAAWLVAMTAMLMSTPALAEPTAAQKETARSLVESGRNKRKEGNTKAALADFEAAHAIMQVPTTGLEVGKSQLELSMLIEARQTFLSIGKIPEEANEPKPFKKARTEAKELGVQLSNPITAERCVVTGLPPNREADIAVDDESVAKEVWGAPIKLNPGKHTVSARIDGLERKSAVNLEEGKTQDVTLNLASLAEASNRSKPHPLVWAGFGAAGLFGIAGAVTGILAMRDYATATAGCDHNLCPPETHPFIDRGSTLGLVSTIGFAVAGAGLAVGVVGFFVPRKTSEQEQGRAPSMYMTVSPTGMGFTGTF